MTNTIQIRRNKIARARIRQIAIDLKASAQNGDSQLARVCDLNGRRVGMANFSSMFGLMFVADGSDYGRRIISSLCEVKLSKETRRTCIKIARNERLGVYG